MNKEEPKVQQKDIADMVDSPLKSAWSSFHKGDYTRCIKNCDEVINYYTTIRYKKYSPEEIIGIHSVKKFEQAWFLKGVALEKLGKYTEAEEYYNRIPNANFPKNWCMLGDMFSGDPDLELRVNNHQMALACYDRAIQIDPKNFDAWLKKGLLYEKLGKSEEAKACFRNCFENISLNELYEKGLLYEELGKSEEAKACFRKISWIELLGLNVFLPVLGLIFGVLLGIAVSPFVGALVWFFCLEVLRRHGISAIKVFFKRF